MKSTLRESALKGCLLSILLGMVLLLKRLIHNFSRCHVSHPCDVEGEGNEVSLVAKTNNQLGDGSMYVCMYKYIVEKKAIPNWICTHRVTTKFYKVIVIWFWGSMEEVMVPNFRIIFPSRKSIEMNLLYVGNSKRNMGQKKCICSLLDCF